MVNKARAGFSNTSRSQSAGYFDADIEFLIKIFPKEVSRAITSASFFTLKAMKTQWRSYTSGRGNSSALQRGRWYDKANQSRTASSARKVNYGDDAGKGQGMGRAFQYRKFDDFRMNVGWQSRSAVKAAKRWQDGPQNATVDSAYRARLLKAAQLAKSKWPYHFSEDKNGKIWYFLPKVGSTIQKPKGQRRFPFMDVFFQRNKEAINNAIKYKLIEKLGNAPRGSSDLQIQVDFTNAARGLKITAVKAFNRAVADAMSQRLRRI